MSLNERIIQRFELTSGVSSEQIKMTVAENSKKQEWSDLFVVDYIDYQEIQVSDNKIEILRNPGVLSAFRPDGKITIDMLDLPDGKTNLKCEIFPYNGRLPLRIGFLITICSVWTIFLLIIAPFYIALLVGILPWAPFGLIYYLSYLYTRSGLIDYSKKVITEITKVRKAV